MHPKHRPYFWSFTLLGIALILSFVIGSVTIPLDTVARILLDGLGLDIAQDWPATHTVILLRLRLPHTILVALTGAALAASGTAYQGLFRNPLADPYLIGVASGAGLGAVLAMAINWPAELLGYFTIPAAAFVGALLTVGLVYALARVNGSLPTTTLILAGVAVGSFATAVTSFLMIRSQEELRRAIAWLLGGSSLGGWPPVVASLPYMAVGLTALIASGHALNILQFSEEQAEQLGLPVNRVKTFLIIAASLTAAAAVAFAGIIGFVGLVVPHLARLLWGSDYRRLLPLSTLGGAALLLFSDVIARRVLAPEVLPLGIITALIGAPFFLWVLRRAKAQAFW